MIFIYVILTAVEFIFSYNIESRQNHRVVFSLNKNDNSSFFGYGVTMQEGRKSVIVSAPYFNNRNGGIFECSADDMRCREIFKSESSVQIRFAKTESKTQHLGATLDCSERYILSCAPSWHQINKNVYWYRGRCTLLEKKLKISHVFPCLKKQAGNQKYGLCVSGISSAIKTVQNKTFVLIGSPGALHFKGIISAHVIDETMRSIFSEIPTAKDHSFIGYSIAWGNFTNSKFGELIGGAPRGNKMKGSVIVYTIHDKRLTERRTIKSPDPQVGSYFGASLCSVDLNGNGVDTLLIGSPMHSKSYDEGRVYVFDVTTHEYVVFNSVLTLEGQSIPGSHFGSTITNIGDIDNDGYLDIAIGCLKNGRSENDGSGAVYIYNGGPNGLRKKYSQVIYASTSPVDGGSGFGLSVAGGVDMDENGYTDIGIGEYLKGKAYLLKSRPVLKLSSSLKANVTDIPPEILRSNCFGPDQKRYYCIMLDLVVRQLRKQAKVSTFTLNVTTEFDKNMFRKRAYLLDPSTKILQSKLTEPLTFNTSSNLLKLSRIVYVSVAVDNDISLPVTIETSFTAYENEEICRQQLCPVLDVYSVKRSSLEIPYLQQCGEDRTCTPDLAIHSVFEVPDYPTHKHITIGSSSNIFFIKTNVTNKEEPAYGTTLRMNISSDIFVVRVEVNKISFPYSTGQLGSKFYQISVPLANPLLTNQTLHVKVKMSLKDKKVKESMYTFGVEVLSTGIDTDKNDNRATVNTPVKLESCVNVDGSINPPLIMYSKNHSLSTSNMITNQGPEVNFTYFVQNSGRLAIQSLITEISLPTHFDDFELLYVYDLTSNGVRCKANKLNVRKYFSSSQDAQAKKENDTHNDVISPRHKRFITNIACTNGTCITYEAYKCVISLIKPRDVIKVNLVTRFLQENMKKIKRKPNEIASKFLIHFGGKNKDIMVQNKDCHSSRTIHALLQESSGLQEDMRYLRWWVLLISIICSIIFLSIICAILYRMGFFKRKKLEEEREDEPKEDRDL